MSNIIKIDPYNFELLFQC